MIGIHESLINPFPTTHVDCRLLSHLLLLFVSLYCKHHGPRSDCSKRSSLVSVHRVCFMVTVGKSRWHFLDKYIERIRAEAYDTT